MSTSQEQSPAQQIWQQTDDIDDIVVQISTGDLTTLHDAKSNEPNGAGFTSQIIGTTALSNILNEDIEDASCDNVSDDEQEHILKVQTTKSLTKRDDIEYHTDHEHDHDIEEGSEQHQDTSRWFRMGTDRSVTPNTNISDTSNTINNNTSKYDLNYIPTQDEQYEDFVLHLRHAASYKAEYDIYQVLAYRAKVSFGQKIYFKPFKALRGMISDTWSELEIRWLNSFQRVLSQAIVCFCIQTLGVTAILITQFSAYFADKTDKAQCDYGATRWKTDWHLKLLAFLWTSFIALGVSGWVYRARHSGFYPVLLFLKAEQYPNFVSIPILQIGLLTNYYVVASSVIGSFVLIYQTEGGTQTIDMILQAVALFFILELDNKIVHARDFLSIRKYFDVYIKNGKHQKIPQSILPEKQSVLMKPLKKCKGNSCLSGTLSIVGFVLLVAMTIGAFLAPWIIMICW